MLVVRQYAADPQLDAGHDGEVITMRDVFVSVVVGALVIGGLVLIMFLG
jgi:hypothetical protein